jgi:DNA-binding NarL/FixJ family response regulator
MSEEADADRVDIRVVVVDDDPLVRAALAMILRGAPGITLVGEAADGAAGAATVRQLQPDVVLMDIRMPGMDGLQALPLLLEGRDPPRVIMLTTFEADDYVARALGSGASGFLLKDTPPTELVAAIHTVFDGDPILTPSVTATLIRQLSASSATGESAQALERAQRLVASLTAREHAVALAVAQGKSNAEVAEELYMSVATVKAHVSRVLVKLESTNRVQIAICMHDAGLL